VYSLYKDQFGLKETIVAALFTTGFLSGGISGYFVGQFADRYGRKTACLVFCVTYSIACFSTLVPKLPVLFLGRVFGGLSTSMMYSAFESWMVTEYHRRGLEKAGTSLSSMFGVMTTLNSIVAILAGVFSEWLVQVTRTKRAPFMASAGLLMIAFWVILTCWVRSPRRTLIDGIPTEIVYRPRITVTVISRRRPLPLPLHHLFLPSPF
jgi:MFS family permease